MDPNPAQHIAEFALHELSAGVFVYRRSAGTAPADYYCRDCLDAGTPALLVREESVAVVNRVCPNCRGVFLERKKPLSGLAMSPW